MCYWGEPQIVVLALAAWWSCPPVPGTMKFVRFIVACIAHVVHEVRTWIMLFIRTQN